MKFLTDEHLFGGLKPTAPSWRPWNVLFKAIEGEPLEGAEAELYHQVAGKDYRPAKVETLVLVCGRRAGKSVNVARLALKEAFTGNYAAALAPGEKAFVLVVSVNLRATRIVLNYMRGFLKASPIMRREVEKETQQEIQLKNGVVIAAYPCSNVSARGLSVAVLIMDEAAFFRSEGATTDLEVYRSIRPGMATFPGSKVFILSSPYSKSGLVYEFYRDYFGQLDDPEILVVKAGSEVMNPTLSARFLEKERERDPEGFAREFEAEFAEGIAEFLPLEAIESCVDWGLYSRPPQAGVIYQCGVDAAGGGSEYFTFAIAHKTEHGTELDMVGGWNQQKPESCVERICAAMKRYNIEAVTGDRYSAGWVSDAFERRGIIYQHAELTKSEFFAELGPEILQGSIRLVEHKKLLKELRMLERKTAQSGRDTIGHPPRGTDDFANALAIASYQVKGGGFTEIGVWDAETMVRLV